MRTTIMRQILIETYDCPTCGILYGAPKEFFDRRRTDGGRFFCPNGHGISFAENEHDRTRRERDRLKQENAHLEDARREAWEAAAAELTKRTAAEKELKRINRRSAAGVCPCCNRTFVALARHMEKKHPEVVPLPQKAKAS